jgi:hypothetical protein
MESYSPLVTPKEFAYSQSPLDQPEFSSNSSSSIKGGPKMFSAIKSIPITDPNLISEVGHSIQLSNTQKMDIQAKCDMKVFELYPQIKDKISHRTVVPPYFGGRYLSNDVAKFSSLINSTTDIPVSTISCHIILYYITKKNIAYY